MPGTVGHQGARKGDFGVVATSKEAVRRNTMSTQVTADQDESDHLVKKFWIPTSVFYRIEASQPFSDNCFSLY